MRIPSTLSLALTLLPVLPLSPGATAAQTPSTGAPSPTEVTGSVTQVEVGPVIDGRLDEAVWDEAEPLTDFVQYEPLAGTPSTERTEVRFLHDADALYIGAWLHDREADRIIVGERRRNADLSQSDAFIVVLDTYQDRQNAFVFGTNPGGIEYDGQVRGAGGVNTNWDGSWEVATSRDGEGWYVEMRIPFSTLRYGSAEAQRWGLNVARYIRRNNEQAFWSPVPRQYDLYRLTEAGVLDGLEPPLQRVATLTPFALSAAQQNAPGQPGTEYPFEVGADAKFGLTGSLALDLTVNTDFAQVEVDDQQVDLTRANLFFPERRPFFLENADLFDVQSPRPGASSTPVRLFHSRRIGIEGGQEVPIQAGTRLSGRVGSTDVGFVYMRTEGLDEVQDPNAWLVGRVAQELPNRSRVGAIFTQRRSREAASDLNRLVAADLRLGLGEEWTFDVIAGRSRTAELDGDGRILTAVGEFRSENWQLSSYFDHIGDHFNPEIGWVRRFNALEGYRSRHARVMRYQRLPGVEWIRELRPHVSYTTNHDLDGFKLSERVHMHTHVEFEGGGLTMPAVDWELEGLNRPFQIAGSDIVVPPGEYSGWVVWSSQNTNRAAPLSFTNRVSVGSFLSGRRTQLSGGVHVRRGGSFTGSVDLTHNRLDLEEGAFNTTLSRIEGRYAFTPRLSLQGSAQYSDQTGMWTGQLRMGWLDTAGTGLFVVFNERQFMEIDGIAGILPREAVRDPERTLVVKYTRQFDLRGWGGS
jgi:hypothetical protein